jgi:16S rRNA (cytosine967-C5)-methyltransferase
MSNRVSSAAMTDIDLGESGSGWPLALQLVDEWHREGTRLDHLLERLPRDLPPERRAQVQDLASSAVRHWSRADAAVARHVQRPGRPAVEALLRLAAAQLIAEAEVPAPLIVDHAVETAKAEFSKCEAGFVNAVLRRAVAELRRPAPDWNRAGVAELAAWYSHPPMMVERWCARWGAEATRRLLEWNQTPAVVHARVRPAAVGRELPAALEPTPWPGFYRLQPGRWSALAPLLADGSVYLQDPATRLAPELAAPRAGENVLDLCAAPGGKTVQLADTMGEGLLVVVDQPGTRWVRLMENLSRLLGSGAVKLAPLAFDVTRLTPHQLAKRDLPAAYGVVLLDAPCSNTGVLRHRIDAKWRFAVEELPKLAALQGRMLAAAAACVAEGGRLVYSTCSLEPEENEQVIERFLATPLGSEFRLAHSVVALPWEAEHDGAGVFLLRRVGLG